MGGLLLMKFVLNTLGEMYHLISWTDRVFYFLPKEQWNNSATIYCKAVLSRSFLKSSFHKWQCYFTGNSLICGNIFISGIKTHPISGLYLENKTVVYARPFIIWTLKKFSNSLLQYSQYSPLNFSKHLPFSLVLMIPLQCFVFLQMTESQSTRAGRILSDNSVLEFSKACTIGDKQDDSWWYVLVLPTLMVTYFV